MATKLLQNEALWDRWQMLDQFNKKVQQQVGPEQPDLMRFSAPRAPKIIIPQSVLDNADKKPDALVDAAMGFVSHMLTHGQFGRDDLPVVAVQAYCCDFYLAQVMDGGHAQFVDNCRHILEATLKDVEAALVAMGNRAHLEVVVRLRDLVKAEPVHLSQSEGFSVGLAASFAALDKLYFAIEGAEMPRQQLARWIAQMKCLNPVPDAEVLPKMTTISRAKRQPGFANRVDNVTRYSKMLLETLSLGLGMAAARAIDPVIMIGKPTSMRLKGLSTSCWQIRTNSGDKLGVLSAAGATIYEISNDPKPELTKDLAAQGVRSILNHRMPTAGKLLAQVGRNEIEEAAGFCDRLMAAAAVDALVQKLPQPTVVDFVSLRNLVTEPDGAEVVALMVVADSATSAYSVVVDESGAQLVSEPDHRVLASVTRAELQENTAPIAATA